MKRLAFKNDAREKLLSGINKLAEAVGSTMGAKGQTVIFPHNEGENAIPLVTKDGVTVANNVFLEDPIENMGAQMMKEAAKNTLKRAGDGTTTATVLAQAILKEAKDNNDVDFLAGLEDAYNKTMDILNKESIQLTGKELVDVATISTNNDNELGKLVADAITEAGEYGVVNWEPNFYGTDTVVEIEHGAVIERGYLDPKFVNDKAANKVVLENPMIFLTTSTIQDVRQIEPVLVHALETKKPLLIIGDLETEVSATILGSIVQSDYRIKIGIIKAPEFGPMKDKLMEDLADVFGAKLHGAHLGDDPDLLTEGWDTVNNKPIFDESFVGYADKVLIDKNVTVVRMAEKPDLSEKVSHLEGQLEGDLEMSEKDFIRKRLAILAGAMGVIKVGAPSEIELKEKFDRVEDAVYAVHAAKAEGILPGGGIALLEASNNLKMKKGDSEYDKGWNAFVNAIKAPHHKILENGGLTSPGKFKKGFGVNVLNGKEVDMVKEGIIDPAKITKQSLINAFSVAKTILTTGAVIYNK